MRERESIGMHKNVCTIEGLCVCVCLYAHTDTTMQQIFFFTVDHPALPLTHIHLCHIELFRFKAHSI